MPCGNPVASTGIEAAFGLGVVFHALDVGLGFSQDFDTLGIQTGDFQVDRGDLQIALGVGLGGCLGRVGDDVGDLYIRLAG